VSLFLVAIGWRSGTVGPQNGPSCEQLVNTLVETSVDSHVRETVLLLKIDVQGHEAHVVCASCASCALLVRLVEHRRATNEML
jgi:hypothetical protein